MAKCKAQKAEADSYYVLPIRAWHWDYMFGLNTSKWRPDEVYADYRHLIVQGELARPRSIAGHQIELAFVPSPDLFDHPSRQQRPSGVGSISRNRGWDVMHGILSMPQNVLPSLLPMLIAERLRLDWRSADSRTTEMQLL
jgi:hypothetical protein